MDNSTIAQTNKENQSSEPKQEILIFRTSPGKEKVSEGLFRFQVSSFSTILVVKVNGFAQMVGKEADWVEYEIPYFLKQGKNLFKIFVQTTKSQREEEFVVTYEPPQKNTKIKPPFNGVFMIGQTQSDNILSVQEGDSKTSAAKNDFLFSGTYEYGISEDSIFSLGAVLKFDRHQNRSLVSEEVLFRQFSTNYLNKNFLGINLNSGLGQSVISLKEANPSDPYKAGEFKEDVQSFFFYISAMKNWSKLFVGSIKIQFDSQNKVMTNTEDGNLTLISIGTKSRWETFRFQARLDSKSTAFEDTSKDYQSTILDLGVSYTWTPWVFGFNFKNTNQEYQNADAASGIVLANKKDEISLNSKYAFTSTSIVGADFKQINQDSNDSTKAYVANQFTAQYIWMF